MASSQTSASEVRDLNAIEAGQANQFRSDASYDSDGFADALAHESQADQLAQTSTNEFDADASYTGSSTPQFTDDYDADAYYAGAYGVGGEDQEFDADASYDGDTPATPMITDEEFDADASYDSGSQPNSNLAPLNAVVFSKGTIEKSSKMAPPDVDETEVTAVDETEVSSDQDAIVEIPNKSVTFGMMPDIENNKKQTDSDSDSPSSEEEDNGIRSVGWGVLKGATVMVGATMAGKILGGIMNSNDIVDEDDLIAGAMYVQSSGIATSGTGASAGAANAQ